MINCEWMTDRIPLVAHGRAEWTDEEAAHLRACPGCASEWRLVEAARGLGTTGARRQDPGQVSRAVLGAREHRHRRWRRMSLIGSLAAAALVAAAVWLGPFRRGPAGDSGVSARVFQLPLAELEGLDDGALSAVLDGLDAPLGEAATPAVPRLGDLQAPELELVLRSLEG
jgi:hypothetical protein